MKKRPPDLSMGWWDRRQEAECLAGGGPPQWARTYTERNAILISIGFDTYAAYLKSDTWAGISSQVLAKGKKCWVCHRKRSATQCHHDIYTRRNLLGETLSGIYPICNFCHMAIEFKKKGKRSLIKVRAESRRLRNWKRWPKIVERKVRQQQRRYAKRARRLRAQRERFEMEGEIDRLIDRD